MTVDECVELLTPYALAMRADIDAPTFRAYARVLKAVPVHVCAAALEQLTAEGGEFFWPAPKILHAAERARRQMLALRPWTPCVDCEDFPGYRRVLEAGVQQETREKCPCKARHRSLLGEAGMLEPYADLPVESGAGDDRVFPTVEQLPAKLRQQIDHGAARKTLR